MAESDNESIVSLLSESDDEYEPKPVKLKSNHKPTNKSKENKELPVEKEIKYTKTGRVKKEATEAQKKAMAKARVRAREVRKQMSELKKAEKDIKKDALVMRKLEVEAKILEHNEKKKKLFVRAGYINEKEADIKEKKPRAPKGTKERLEDEEEENKVRELEEQLALLKNKKNIKKVEPEPESEPEEENEIIVEKPKVIKRSSIQTPKMELKLKRAEHSNPMARQGPAKTTMDPALMASMKSLFPNWSPP